MTSTETRIDDHGRDVEYYEAHYLELLAQYPDQWIAIMDQEVVGAADDAFKLIAELKAEGKPANRVLRRHMGTGSELLILPILVGRGYFSTVGTIRRPFLYCDFDFHPPSRCRHRSRGAARRQGCRPNHAFSYRCRKRV